MSKKDKVPVLLELSSSRERQIINKKPAKEQECISECEALVAQSCPTLCDPMDCRPPGPGSSVHGILQARILEWVAISFSISLWRK